MCCVILVCAVLKTLHFVEHILNEEECRSVGKAWNWCQDELAVVIAMKPPGTVQESLGVLEEYKREYWYDRAANRTWSDRTTVGIKSKLYFRHQLV